MTDSSVSVVIPTFNSAKFLGTTLDSVFRQTRPPLEVIISDDASVDGTLELAKEIAASSPVPVRIVEAEVNSGGPARPLNRGIAAASGEIIATLDHDDLFLPSKLERSIACMRALPASVLITALCRIPEVGAKSDRAELWQANILRDLQGAKSDSNMAQLDRRASYERLIDGQFLLTCSNMVFPRETWRRVGGYSEGFRISADYDFLRRCLEHGELGFVDETLAIWTPRPSSLYRSADSDDLRMEYLRVITAMRPNRLLTPDRCRMVSRRIREELFHSAYEFRNRGKYRLSAGLYLKGICQGGWNVEGIAGLVKLLPHYILSWKRSTRTN